MKITKREGKLEELSLNKIVYRLKKLATDKSLGKLSTIDTDIIAQKVISTIYDGVSSTELDEEAARISISMTENLECGKLASRIIISNIHKNTTECFSEVMEKLYTNVDSNGNLAPILADDIISIIREYKDQLNEAIDYSRDYLFDYFGFKTLEKSYLMKINGKVVERPQHLYMRVALFCNQNSIENTIKTYHLLSQHYFTMASPVMFNSCSRLANCVSCFTEDTIVSTINKGPIQIKDVEIGDLVITHLGNIKKVEQLHKNLLNNRKLYEVNISKTVPIKVTDNHKLFAITKVNKNGEKSKFGKGKWVSIEELQKGDYVSIPNKIQKIEYTKILDTTIFIDLIENNKLNCKIDYDNNFITLKTQWEHNAWKHVNGPVKCERKHLSIKRHWDINHSFAKFIGIFYGDGHIITRKDSQNNKVLSGIGITIHNVNDELIKFCEEVGEKIFGIKSTIHKMKDQNTIQILYNSAFLGEIFKELFGINFNNKKMWLEMYKWDKNMIISLLEGLVTTDGCISKSNVLSFQMSNVKFMRDLYYLLRNNNIDASYGKEKRAKKGTENHVCINIPISEIEKDEVNKYYTDDRMKYEYKPKCKNQFSAKIVNGFKFLKFEGKIEITENLPEYVYTLGVEDDHSYNIGGIIAENCFLLGTDDSITGIFKTIGDCAQISKVGGGIGVHINNIRSKGAIIKGTNGVTDGIIPMLKVYNECAKYVNQAGKRKGSFAIYLSPEHPDIFDFLDLRKNQGSEDMRARDLFLAMWISDLFMKQVESDSDWYLMDPQECPGLVDVYGEKYEELYWSYVSQGKFRRKVKAQEIWMKILESQIETGTPYILYKDRANKMSNQKNIGVIKSSNLCVAPETMILTSNGYFKIKELENQEINIWNGQEFTKTKVQKTGENQELIKVKLSNGSELECTPYHKFYIAKGKRPNQNPMIKKIEAKDLTKDMKLIKSEFPIIKEGLSEFPYPYEHGIFSADGTLEQKKETIFQCNYKSLEGKCYCGYHIKIYEEKDTDTDTDTDHPTIYCQGIVGKGNPRITLYGEKKKLVQYINSRLEVLPEDNNKRINIRLPIELKPKYTVPINHNIDIKLRWLEGLSDGDGCICKSANANTTAIQISSIHKEFLENVKYLLHTLGCDPKVLIMNEEGMRLLPKNDGSNELGEYLYNCQTCYRLLITSWDVAKLYELGFRPKRLKISGIYPKNNTKRWIQVNEIIKTERISDTYCFKEEKRGMGIFNGILTGQCSEILLYSDDKQYACCNLSSIALSKFVEYDKNHKPFYNHQHLFDIAKHIVLPMNNIIDCTFYPVPETKLSNELHRPIGVGVQDLSGTFIKMRLPFDSDEAKKLNKEIFETIYYGLLTGSMELAKKDGSYSSFKGSPMSEGKFQFDLHSEFNGIDIKDYISGRWDWETLRKDIIEFGVRNSTVTTCMPTASSAQIMGNTESFEQFDSCIFKRRVLAGEFTVVNKHLVEDLTELKLWNKEMKDLIIAHNGSIQEIETIPENIRNLYKTIWEIKMKDFIDQSADRSVFIDQTQSLNLFMSSPTIKKLTNMHFYGFNRGLKTGMYYLRSRSQTMASKFTIDPKLEKKIKDKKSKGKSLTKKEVEAEAILMCSIENKEDCMMCSS